MIGRQLGRWIIDRELGRGAMGSVYRGHAEDSPDEIRAIKVLAPELSRDPVARQRFRRESDVLCHLDHPNIVRFDGAGVDGETLYYVMEFIDGPDGDSRLRERGRWNWAEVLDLAIQVARGLKYAHDQGVVHRDLKPANLLLCPAGPESEEFIVKIADFGVARMFTQGNLTGSGQFIGTALYMAPEQAAGKPATKRSDFYALGGVMYTLLTGRPPFNGASLAELVHKHQFTQPERPSRLRVDLPHDIDELVMVLLPNDPAQRPADGSVLIKRLESIRGKLVRKHDLADTAFRGNGSQPEISLPSDKPPATPRSPEPSLPSRGQFAKALILGGAFLGVVALIVWGIFNARPNADDLYQSARPLMSSSNPNDWDKAWNDYLEPLTLRYPEYPRKPEIDLFRQQMDDYAAVKRLGQRQARFGPRSEAQRFYELGLQRCQQGQIEEGRRQWEMLVQAFAGVEAEQRWVRLAQRALNDVPAVQREPQLTIGVLEALKRARQHRDEGKLEQANAVWDALEALYRNDPEAGPILDEIKRDRGK